MNDVKTSHNFEYYPFCLADGKEAYTSGVDFIKGFAGMAGCQIAAIEVLAMEDSTHSTQVSIEELDRFFSENPFGTACVSGVYHGKAVSFIFTCGILTATAYDSNRETVEKIVTDVCEHSF